MSSDGRAERPFRVGLLGHGTVGGAFQGYTLGNILGAQFYAAAVPKLRSSHAACSNNIAIWRPARALYL